MAQFGRSSASRLETCHVVAQRLMLRVIQERDCSITCGHRPDEEQDELYAQGRTKPGKIVTNAKAGESEHNSYPSMAWDVVPWPEKWSSEAAFLDLHEIIMKHWKDMQDEGLTQGLQLRWGGDWDSDGDRTDQTFNDLPHYELV